MSDDAFAIEISRIGQVPLHFDQFLNEAEAEGFDSMSVLLNEWADGTNRFDRPGEILALATIGGELAGIGAITRDFVDTDWLRMRRFYVRTAYRRRGVGRKLAVYVLEHARPFNRQICLYADGTEAELFWPTLGFIPTNRKHTTHVLGVPNNSLLHSR